VPDISIFATLTEFVSSGAGTIILITGALAGSLRAGAILLGAAPQRFEWMTAAGFIGGEAGTILVVCVDKILLGG